MYKTGKLLARCAVLSALSLTTSLKSQTTQTFNFTGSVQTWTVPACVTSVTISSFGAQGANAAIGGTGGLGGSATGTLAVNPGDVLYIYVGGQNGYNGGGQGGQNGNPSNGSYGGTGGGASDVRVGGTALSNRVIVAGGGGGGGHNGTWPGCQVAGPGGDGGAGGGIIGATGTAGVGTPCNCAGGGGAGGLGGTSAAGGSGSGYAGNTACLRSPYGSGGNGSLGLGGAGSLVYYNGTGGGGGGGGGYYGGGAGGQGSDTTPGGGGGGGSSFTGTLTSASTTSGTRSGNGQVVITYSTSGGAPSQPASISGLSAVCVGTTTTYSIAPVVGATTYTWTVPAGTVINSGQGTTSISVAAGATSGNVTVTAGNTCGTSSPTTFFLTVNPLPTVTASSANPAICVGGSTSLTAGGATGYVWSTGGTSATEQVSPTTTTTYTVTGTDANNCVNTATVTVNVNALPTVNLGADVTQCGGTVTLDAQNTGAMFMWSDSSAAQTLTATATGTYAVMVTDTNGCMNSDTINVTLNSNPTVSLGSDTTTCGGTVTLDAQNTGAMFMWSDSSSAQTLTVSSSGTYYVSVTDANGCEGSDTITVTINTPPTVSGTASSTTVCLDDANVTLTGSPAGGTWSGPGVSGNAFDPSVGIGTQSLTYSFTDANGCTNTDGVSIQVNACVGVEENAGVAALEVYPVPFNQSVNLINNGSEPVTVIIYAADGRVVTQLQLMSGRTELNTAAWSNGFYFLQTPGSTIKLLKSE